MKDYKSFSKCLLVGLLVLASSLFITSFAVASEGGSISFGGFAPKTYGDTDFTVSASGGNGLDFSYNVIAGTACTISGNTVHIVSAGTCTIQASQSNDDLHDPVSPVSQVLTVGQKTLTATATGVNKVFNRTTTATVTFSDDRINSDTITVSGSASFISASVGTAKTVLVSGMSLSGSASANYVLASTTTSTTADITPVPLTVSFTAGNKVYDGTTNAVILSRSISSGVLFTIIEETVTTDDVTVSGGTANFADASVGTGKTVTALANSFTLGGADAGNYQIGTVNPATADITPASQPETPQSSGGSGGYGGRGIPQDTTPPPVQTPGEIAQNQPTPAPLPTTCQPYLTSYLVIGGDNPQDQVDKLRSFLISFEGAKIATTGMFDQEVYNAVVTFQEKYSQDVLAPWGITQGTGYVYITTIAKINALYCGH